MEKDLDVSLLGSLNCIKIFGNEMTKNGGGVILNIASDLALIAPDNRIYNSGKNIRIVKPISYSVAKHGIVGLTKYVAVYWAKMLDAMRLHLVEFIMVNPKPL